LHRKEPSGRHAMQSWLTVLGFHGSSIQGPNQSLEPTSVGKPPSAAQLQRYADTISWRL
jgi:hypothetical protein